jgi:nitric oxide reductase activation protein
VKRLNDGEDIDFDALIDFVIGRKAGQSSEAKIYWRRNKTERDVSVVFLLDMSSSTIEYIDRLRGDPINPVFARDYRDYFEWLHSDHKGGVLRPKEFKRIIDLEKESTVLLIRALEAIGDSYGIYGFSGHGRENVEFYVVKDLEEDFSDRVKNRIDSIVPQQGTRMGPAIRHATWKLERQESRGKFLFLISDGRPEDHSYGREGLEKDYAINDTRMALMEARRKGITSLCLTFDRAGHDYLRTICSDMQYEVLADIESLPACLPALYGWFTT